MLFARFLAETGFLLDPEMGIAITLEECEELARDGGEGMWVYASRCGPDMLPQIFRSDDPLLPNRFCPQPSLWVGRLTEWFYGRNRYRYRYYRLDLPVLADQKGLVSVSGDNIDADEISAATQLFTEGYMVEYLLRNILGVWWAGKLWVRDGVL